MYQKYGIFYNQQFNVLMLNFNNENIVETIEQKQDLTILKNQDKIIGINIFNVPKELNLTHNFYSEDPLVIKYVEQKIKSIIEINQEAQFKIGQVEICEPIEGTHLHKLIVNIGESTAIVCGAKNIAANQIVVVATIGAYMPNGNKIIPGKVRGYDSFGMVCSARELGLGNSQFNQEGIIELDQTYASKVGQSFWKEFYTRHAKI